MARLRVHLIKNGNDFIEFQEKNPIKVKSTKLPKDLLVENDIVTSVQHKDIRGKDKKYVNRAINQLKNGQPMFIEILKSGFDPDWLDPNTEVRIRCIFTQSNMKIAKFSGITMFHLM